MKSGAKASKASTPYKNTDGQPRISKPPSDALMLHVPGSIQGIKGGQVPTPAWSVLARVQTYRPSKIRTFLVLPDNWASSQELNLLTSPSQELKLLDKRTHEHLECSRHHHPLPLLLHRMKNEGDITTHKTKKDFGRKELLESSSDLS